MVKRIIKDEEWRDAVIRVATGQTSEIEEAKRLGVAKSTMSRKVAAIGPTLKGDPAGTPGTSGTPGTASGQGPKKTPLEIAREAAEGSQSPEIQKAVASANLDDAKFCVETIQNYKSAGVFLVAQFSGVPPMSPELGRVAALSEMAKGAIAQNASWLAPVLRQASSPQVLYAILGIEALLAYMAIRKIAAKYAPPEDEIETGSHPPPPSPVPVAAEPLKEPA